MLEKAQKVGINFGATSGVTTTLGLIVGLHSSTQSRVAVIGGIITIAIADALSDAFGIHLSEESQQHNSDTHVWKATLYTFLFKFFITLTFLFPVLIFDITLAIGLSIIWGLLILLSLSYRIGRIKKINPIVPMLEHILLAGLVITLSYYVGRWVALKFS